MADVEIIIKKGSGYADPWVRVMGHDRTDGSDPEASAQSVADDTSRAIEKLREMGAFSSVALISQEFQGAPAAGVESVLASFPNAQVINEDAGPLYPASQAPPEQSYPPCTKCGAPTKPRSGVGQAGPYSGFACTADRKHFDLTK